LSNATVAVTIFVKFPKHELKRIPKEFSQDFELGYRNNEETLCLGTISDVNKHEDQQIDLLLEVRKDETPMWYLQDIINTARNKEIVFMKGEECVSKKGKITSVEIPEESENNQIVYPFFAILFSDDHS